MVVIPPVTAVALVTLLAPVASADSNIPNGYEVAARTGLAPGVEHLRLVQLQPPMVVNVARVAPDAPVSFQAVLSNERVAGSEPLLERTSSMCIRIHCLVALNGDFAAVGLNQPIGGVVTDGKLIRTPNETHHQLSITTDGKMLTGSFAWTGTLVPTDLKPLALGGVNVARAENQIVLYTPSYGATVEPAGSGTSIVLRTVEPAGPLRLGQTALVELVSLHEEEPNLAIPPDGAILSGHGTGAEALRDLWTRLQAGTASARALLRLETPEGVVESVGGSPILLRDGKRWFADVDDNFTKGRHPRTLMGWNTDGETLLVTVDGRQPGVSVGMTLAEAADLLIALGATEGINLDGGGSTTFVVNGEVSNQPSDVAVRRGGDDTIRHMAGARDKVIGHVERPVANAIAVVPSQEVAAPTVDPLAGPSLDLPQALAVPAVAASDPGSVPDGGLPALVTEEASSLSDTVRTTAVAANVSVAVALCAWVVKRRQKVRTVGGGRRSRHRRDSPALAS